MEGRNIVICLTNHSIQKVAVADFSCFGRGMGATSQINEGEVAVSVPRKMILNVETAYADEKLGMKDKKNEKTPLTLHRFHFP
jgi:hypothetical protein